MSLMNSRDISRISLMIYFASHVKTVIVIGGRIMNGLRMLRGCRCLVWRRLMTRGRSGRMARRGRMVLRASLLVLSWWRQVGSTAARSRTDCWRWQVWAVVLRRIGIGVGEGATGRSMRMIIWLVVLWLLHLHSMVWIDIAYGVGA